MGQTECGTRVPSTVGVRFPHQPQESRAARSCPRVVTGAGTFKGEPLKTGVTTHGSVPAAACLVIEAWTSVVAGAALGSICCTESPDPWPGVEWSLNVLWFTGPAGVSQPYLIDEPTAWPRWPTCRRSSWCTCGANPRGLLSLGRDRRGVAVSARVPSRSRPVGRRPWVLVCVAFRQVRCSGVCADVGGVEVESGVSLHTASPAPPPAFVKSVTLM